MLYTWPHRCSDVHSLIFFWMAALHNSLNGMLHCGFAIHVQWTKFIRSFLQLITFFLHCVPSLGLPKATETLNSKGMSESYLVNTILSCAFLFMLAWYIIQLAILAHFGGCSGSPLLGRMSVNVHAVNMLYTWPHKCSGHSLFLFEWQRCKVVSMACSEPPLWDSPFMYNGQSFYVDSYW